MVFKKDGLVFASYLKGFTLVELLVGIAVMTIILGVTLSGGPQAIMRITLANNTYETELTIREAQIEGSAINSVNGTFGGAGVFFDRATSSKTLKFKDIIDPTITRAIGIGNGLYDSSPVDEKVVVLTTSNNHRIGKLCVASSTHTTLWCNDAIPTVPIKTLTISFTRPKQNANIYINGTTTYDGVNVADYTEACIQFDSRRSPEPGYVKSIRVYQSGMVTKTSKCE
jgi:prepilin-type N-terminal cleavage/methylation domain-containing protein